MLPAIPDGLIAVRGRDLGDDRRRRPAANRAELPCPRPAEARLLAIRPRRAKRACRCGPRLATAATGPAELRTVRLHDRCVRARTRPARHPRLARGRRRAQRRIAGRDRDARAGASRSLRRLVAAAARPSSAASSGLHPAVRFLARRLDVDREAACDDRVVSCTGAARRYASALLAVAAASNPDAGRIEFAAGVPAATTTASALRVRVGRLLDPRRDRGARLAGATSLVSVTALALAVVMSTQVAPAVVFLDVADVDRADVLRPRRPQSSRAARRSRHASDDRGCRRRCAERPPRRTVTRCGASDPVRAAGSGSSPGRGPRRRTHRRRRHSTAASWRRTATRR